MRSVTIGGVPAYIFDEKTHPLGLEYKKTEVVVGEKILETKVVETPKVTVTQKVAEIIKKKK